MFQTKVVDEWQNFGLLATSEMSSVPDGNI
jgi:hypothetical protein